MTIMYDSTSVASIPADAKAVAGYVDGPFENFGAMVARFPTAYHLSITGHAGKARCFDIEPGLGTPDQAPGWFRGAADHAHGKPVLYADGSEMPQVIDALSRAGIARSEYMLWLAQPTGTPHLPPGMDACQYQWTQGWDASQCSDAFFGPPPDPHHYDRFSPGPFNSPMGMLNEHRIVLQYDGARKHPIKYRKYLARVLRPRCRYLANRIKTVADEQHDWEHYWRRWRYEQLVLRADGKKVI